MQLKTLARAAVGHRASWRWLTAFAGPAWPCSSAESSYSAHLSPIVFLNEGVDEDICSFLWSNDPLLQLLGLRAQSARPARLDGRLESAARPAAAEEPHRLEPGRRRAGKKLHGCWWVSFSAINAQFWSSARKLIVTQTQTQATFPPHRQIKLAV